MTSEKSAQRRAVRRAIRTGHAPDARIAELARKRADQTVGQSAVVKIYAVLLVIQLALLGVRLGTGGSSAALVLTLVGDVLWIAGVAVMAVNLSRSRRYLRDHPEAQP